MGIQRTTAHVRTGVRRPSASLGTTCFPVKSRKTVPYIPAVNMQCREPVSRHVSLTLAVAVHGDQCERLMPTIDVKAVMKREVKATPIERPGRACHGVPADHLAALHTWMSCTRTTMCMPATVSFSAVFGPGHDLTNSSMPRLVCC